MQSIYTPGFFRFCIRGGETTSMNYAPFSRCVECDEVITNPICSECLASSMRLVVQEHDTEAAKLIVGIDIEGDTTCIQCGKNMGLCAHCFSKDIYEFLQETNQRVAREFASRFDFQIRSKITEFA